MKKINTKLLNEICTVPGASGFEDRIRKTVIGKIKNHVDSYEVDNLGNLITFKKGKNNPDKKKIAIAAHLDEIGFMVTHIDDNGFLKFHTLGGFDPKTLTALRVIVHGEKDLFGVMGSRPVHMMSPQERTKMPKTTDFYIDLGLPKEEVEKLVPIGSPVTRKQDFMEIGNLLNCKSFDNRLSVYILIETLQQLKNFPYDVYGVFTVQEEVGIRGANVAGHRLNPDFGIALDVTIANDTPGASPHEKITEMGKGTAIKIMDGATICDSRMVKFLKEIADKNKISWQPEILPMGGTDTAGIQRMGKNGAIAGALSIPLRYMHQTTETIHPEDVKATIQLLIKAISSLDKFNWEF